MKPKFRESNKWSLYCIFFLSCKRLWHYCHILHTTFSKYCCQWKGCQGM